MKHLLIGIPVVSLLLMIGAVFLHHFNWIGDWGEKGTVMLGFGGLCIAVLVGIMECGCDDEV